MLRRVVVGAGVAVVAVGVIAAVVSGLRARGEGGEASSAPFTSSASSSAPSASPWPTPFSVDLRSLPPAEALPPGTLRVLTLGDSVAQKLGLALRFRQEEARAFVAARGVGDCSILVSQELSAAPEASGRGGGCAARWVEDVRELRPDLTLVVLGGAYFARVTEGRVEHTACAPRWRQAYDARLEELLGAMAPFAGRVVLATAPYPLGRWRWPGVVERVDCLNALLVDVAARDHRERLDLAGYVCPMRDCVAMSAGAPLRPDGLHFDGVGAEATARWVLAELTAPR